MNPEYSLEGLMLQLKLQYFSHLMQRADLSLSKLWEMVKDRTPGVLSYKESDVT